MKLEVFQKVWRLESLAVKSGTDVQAEVEVVLKSKGKKYFKKITGDGSVDACYRAIDSITKSKGELLEYSIQSVTRGKDALGEVTVKVKHNGIRVIAHGG